jgi:hypothetical protein
MRALVFTLLLAAGCATPVASRGTLPLPPVDADLANDGSAAQQAMLVQRYAVRVEGDRVRVGEAQRAAQDGLLGTQVDGDVSTYLGDGGAFPSTRRAFMAAAGLGLIAASVGLAFLVMPMPLVGGMVWIGGLEFMAQWVVTQPVLRPNAIPLAILFSFMGTLFVQAVGTVVITPTVGLLTAGTVLVDLARRQTRAGLEDAATRHNAQLQQRIQGAVLHPAPSAD